MRINQNGSTDNTYGTSGWSIVDFGIHANSTVSSVLRNNGKLVVSSMYRQFLGAGQNLDTTYFGILQLDSNGTLDYSFAPSGVYKQTINFRELSSRYDEVRLFSSSLAPNNKIILVGAAYDCKTLSSCIFDGLAARFHLNSNKKQYTDMEKMDKQKLLVFVYPNPFEKEISIQIDDNSENLIIQIVDVSGKIVFYESGTFTSKKITIRDISKGIYFLKINTSDGKRSEIKRIVKI